MKRSIIAALLIGGVSMSTSLMASDILAEVNGVKITKAEANDFIHRAQPNQPALSFDTLPQKDRQAIVKRLVERELFAEAAQKAGIDKDPAFLEALKKAKEELMIRQWMKKQFESTIVSESEAKAFYQKHLDKFKIPEQVHARHILVKSEKKAQEIIDRLKGLKGDALKKKFIELAKSESTGPTGPKGGDLGYFSKEQMVLPFAKAAFALKKGEITTKPVKTQFGWHVIYLEDRKAARQVPFEQVKERIIQALKQKNFAAKMEKEVNVLKKQAKIVYTTEPNEKKETK